MEEHGVLVISLLKDSFVFLLLFFFLFICYGQRFVTMLPSFLHSFFQSLVYTVVFCFLFLVKGVFASI